MVANVANMLPKFAVVGKASEQASKREEELFASLLPGDVGIRDRAYNNFPALYRQTLRGVFFVIREKEPTKYRVVKRVARKDARDGVLHEQLRVERVHGRRAVQGEMGGRASFQGTQADAPAPVLLRRKPERRRMADMGGDADAPCPALHQVEERRVFLVHAIRGDNQEHDLAEAFP